MKVGLFLLGGDKIISHFLTIKTILQLFFMFCVAMAGKITKIISRYHFTTKKKYCAEGNENSFYVVLYTAVEAVEQLVEALLYKTEVRGLDS